MKHEKQAEIEKLIKHDMNVLLEGPAGTGKSTIIKNVAEELEFDFYSISMTKQTTLNALIGFLSINGNYIPSQLRTAVEHGGIMLLDEIDASDPNTLLCLNSLENGYLACPDGVIQKHKDFRLVATSNPSGEHQIYTGRSKLDAATLSRFDIVTIDRDPALELLLTDEETAHEVNLMRSILDDNNSSKTLSMRDCIRLHKRKSIGLATGYVETLLGDKSLVSSYNVKLEKSKPPPKPKEQYECSSIDELWGVVNTEGKHRELEQLQQNAQMKARMSGKSKFTNEYMQELYGQVTADAAAASSDRSAVITAEDRWNSSSWDLPEPRPWEEKTQKPKKGGIPTKSSKYSEVIVKSAVRNFMKVGTRLLPGVKIQSGASATDPLGEFIHVRLDDGRQFRFDKNSL